MSLAELQTSLNEASTAVQSRLDRDAATIAELCTLLKERLSIETGFRRKPIPTPLFDWEASIDERVGSGATEAAAIIDLLRQ